MKILIGDTIEQMRTLPDASVHCCVTSPPYWGLRDYGVGGQIGLEATPELFTARMVEVFAEVRRVLHPSGTCWVNLGDSYAGSWGNYGGQNRGNGSQRSIVNGSSAPNPAWDGRERDVPPTANVAGLKPKDLCGIPWLVAFALRADGWWLRQDIIWAKPNPMPESVTDRCTKSHEYLFLLTKSARYYFDAEAIKEPSTCPDDTRPPNGSEADGQRLAAVKRMPPIGGIKHTENGHNQTAVGNTPQFRATRNRRSVWTITPQPFKEAHFATYPEDLVEPCIRAGTSERGCCPKCLAPWERVVERVDTGLTQKMPDGMATHAGGHGSFHQNGRESGKRGNPVMADRTTGWQPTCDCPPHEPRPCVVLDPFLGSGTTLLVARKLGRDGIGCELNPTYAAMAERRIGDYAPLFGA